MSSNNGKEDRINWVSGSGFILMHMAVVLVFWAGFSWIAVAAMAATYGLRMFAITAGFHRYFSHRTFKTSRAFQFVLAFLGTTAVQKGPLWWAAHHRHHHKHSDTGKDLHSPSQSGFWWSHVGWILSDKYKDTNEDLIKDTNRYPELRWLDYWHLIPPVIFGIILYGTGWVVNSYYPQLGTSGFQILIWGGVVSTVLLYHGTFTVNSLAHVIGKRRFETRDDSKNNFLISLITLGEGWHNNHHRFPSSERQGLYWWEIDISHYILKFLSWFKIVWDLRTPPERVYEHGRKMKWPAHDLNT